VSGAPPRSTLAVVQHGIALEQPLCERELVIERDEARARLVKVAALAKEWKGTPSDYLARRLAAVLEVDL